MFYLTKRHHLFHSTVAQETAVYVTFESTLHESFPDSNQVGFVPKPSTNVPDVYHVFTVFCCCCFRQLLPADLTDVCTTERAGRKLLQGRLFGIGKEYLDIGLDVKQVIVSWLFHNLSCCFCIVTC